MNFINDIENKILWVASMFLFLMGIGSFFYSILAGILFVIGGAVLNPFLIEYCRKRRFRINIFVAVMLAAICGAGGFICINNANQDLSTINNKQLNDTSLISEETSEGIDKTSAEEISETITNDKEPIPISVNNNAKLTIYYIDVGQGDATLILCDGEAMLIDGGPDSKGTFMQKFLYDHNIGKLKYVIATHPYADHIGGLDVIITKFDCEMIFMPEVEKDTNAYESLIGAIKYRNYKITSPDVEPETKYYLGDAYFQILSPRLVFSDSNDNSIAINLHYHNNKFLFLGDALIPPQQEMMYGGLDIKADVIKVPHHGSKTAYIRGFYDEVDPKYAVISCGKDNSYGHPNDEVINGLKNMGIHYFRTDQQGTIIAESDGTAITWNVNPVE